MTPLRRIGACAGAAMAAAGWVHVAAAGPSSPSTAIAPHVLRDQSQRPADAINRAVDPARSAPGGDKEQAPKASEPTQVAPSGMPSASPKPTQPGSK